MKRIIDGSVQKEPGFFSRYKRHIALAVAPLALAAACSGEPMPHDSAKGAPVTVPGKLLSGKTMHDLEIPDAEKALNGRLSHGRSAKFFKGVLEISMSDTPNIEIEKPFIIYRGKPVSEATLYSSRIDNGSFAVGYLDRTEAHSSVIMEWDSKSMSLVNDDQSPAKAIAGDLFNVYFPKGPDGNIYPDLPLSSPPEPDSKPYLDPTHEFSVAQVAHIYTP